MPMDFRAITPLVWEHINPYGRYDLDMESRLAICALPCLRAALAPKWPLTTRVCVEPQKRDDFPVDTGLHDIGSAFSG
jgi:hypothetical protein